MFSAELNLTSAQETLLTPPPWASPTPPEFTSYQKQAGSLCSCPLGGQKGKGNVACSCLWGHLGSPVGNPVCLLPPGHKQGQEV